MEKMSGILPSSPRVTSVDLKDSPPARPGAPGLGKKTGRNTVADRVTLSPRAKEMASEETLLGKKAQEVSRVKAVNEINRKFFETRLKPVGTSESISEKVTDSIASNEETAPLSEAIGKYESTVPAEPILSTLKVEA